MKINVGSKNKVKKEAVEETIQAYPFLAGAKVVPCKPVSHVSKQPMSLEETLSGAINRAVNCFVDCDYSFGIESGLTPSPQAKTGYFNICACAIYDGKDSHLGVSSGFEHPNILIEKVIKENLSIEEAAHATGFTKVKRIGRTSGILNILTKGRLTRKQYTKQAVQMALIHLDNPESYYPPIKGTNLNP